MDDILTTEEVTTTPIVKPEDDFDGFVSMMSGGAPDMSNDEETEKTIQEEFSEDELPPSLRKPKEEDEEDNEEKDEEDSEEDSDDNDEHDEEESDNEDESDEDDDGLEVSLDTVITLPDGTERSIEELTAGYTTLTELKERETALSERATTIENKESRLDDALALAKLEADDVLDKFEGFDWAALLQESPEEYGKTKMFVERYEKRAKEIRNLMSERATKASEEKDEELKRQATSCVTTLSKEIPGWNSNLYNDILNYAVEKGTNPEFIQQCTDAGVIKAFYTAMKFEKGENIVRAKIKRGAGSPSRTLKAGGGKAPVKKTVNTTGLMGREADEFSQLASILNRK